MVVFVFFFYFLCATMCVVYSGQECIVVSSVPRTSFIRFPHICTHTNARTRAVAGVYLVERAKQEACLCVCLCVCVCVCGCTSTGVCRLIKFISSGHVAAGNQCCEGKRPRRQSVCVCVCACVCKPVYLCVSLGRRMANISTADDPLLLTHTRSR